MGIETDFDALILHGDNENDIVDLSTVTDSSVENVKGILRSLYPNMPSEMIYNFLPLILGNIRHIDAVRKANRPVEDIVHKEWVLAFGRGFDWFHEPNTAIIVGPFDEELRNPITTAARLLLSNLKEGRVSRKSVVLVSSAPYRNRSGYDHLAARKKAIWQNDFAMRVITQNSDLKDLLPHLRQLTAVMDMETRALEIISST